MFQLDKGAADEQRKGAVAAKKLRDAESVINNLKGQLQTQREESQSASLKLKHSDKEVSICIVLYIATLRTYQCIFSV